LPSIREASPLPVVAVCAKVQPRKNPN
jgi:hypothetical protein